MSFKFSSINNYNEALPTELSAYQYEIFGQAIRCQYTVTNTQRLHSERFTEDFIKEQLAAQLVTYMINQGFVEFTKLPVDAGISYRARCFLTPDTQVKLLRTAGKIL